MATSLRPLAAASPAPVPSEGGRLARSQLARRTRVLTAVIDLAQEGGYDAIQLRPIAERTGIAVDTIYRYFGSRDQLISAAVARWGDEHYREPASTWAEGDTPAERLLSFYRQVWDAWEGNPNMLETFVRAALADGDAGADDGLAARARQTLVPLTAAILDDVDADYRDDVLMIMESVTHSAMTYVVRQQLRVDEVFPLIERTVRRLAQHPAMNGSRPKSWEWKPK